MHAAPLKRVGRLTLLLVVCLPMDTHPVSRPSLLHDLRRIAHRTGTRVTPRLSISPDHRAGAAGRTTLGPTSPEVLAVAKRVNHALADGAGAEALHASALLDLVWGNSAESAGRVIATLETVQQLAEPSATLLADLSAAYLVRAQRAGTPRDLFASVEAAAAALELEPRNAAARFNLALALHRIGLHGEAGRAWRDFAAVDSVSGWAGEARAGMRSLSAPEGAPRPPAGSSPVDLAAYAERAPQEARLLALNGLLGEWGEAVLHGDAVRARDRLRAVSAIAESLERRGGDATLADAVRVIRTHAGDSVTVRKLAMAHSAYTRAQRHLDQRVADSAHAAFEVAHAYAGASPALAQWAAYSRGVALFYGGARGVEALFRQVAARADPVRHPALAGRAHWSLGTLLLRRGAYAEARRRYLEAARLFRRAGEREHLGAVQAMETEALFGMGDEDTGFASAYRAIETLHPYRQGSLWLHNLLYVTAQAATARGLRRAALRVHDEGVSVAAHVRPAVHAEALLTRALARTAAGDREGAARDVEASRALIASLPPTFQRTWLEQDLRLAYAELSIRTHPALALAALDSVVSFFGSGRVRPRLNAALPRRAEANLVLGDTAAAVADLSRVAAVLDTLSGAEGAGVRASMLETARQVSDRLAMLHVRAGQASRALAALERGRASFGPTGAIAQRGEGGSLRGPPGEIAVEYALVGDTLLVFTLADTAVRLHTRVVDRHAMLRRIDRLRSALEVRQPLDSVSGDLAVLYDQLVRPVRSRLGEGVSLVLIADGEVAGVPFAALRDGARARYLVQDHTLRFANTLAEAAHPERRPEQPSRDVLFVADPAFEPREHPGLQRLPGLAADTRRIAQGYPGAVVLTGAEARRDALATALKQAGIFHFAGHAVFDDQRPVRSYLVLAPGGEAPGRLTAAEIARMDLGHLRLVVLSACQTQRSTSGRSGGFAGLSGAMLAAGAGGVVGSLWRVNDALTRELMVGFHHAYRGSGDGADALRQAQLRLLDADDPALRSPAAWAGFRYAGG